MPGFCEKGSTFLGQLWLKWVYPTTSFFIACEVKIDGHKHCGNILTPMFSEISENSPDLDRDTPDLDCKSYVG